jgi:hypothetical protein
VTPLRPSPVSSHRRTHRCVCCSFLVYGPPCNSGLLRGPLCKKTA